MFAKIDQKIIDFLTRFCCLTKDNWEIDNVTLAYLVSIFLAGMYVVGDYFLLTNFFVTGNKIGIVISSFIFVAAIIFFIFKVFFSSIMKEHFFKDSYPQGKPNPCRFSKDKFQRRTEPMIILFMLLVVFFINDHTKMDEYDWIFLSCLLIVLPLLSLVEYLMACDSKEENFSVDLSLDT